MNYLQAHERRIAFGDDNFLAVERFTDQLGKMRFSLVDRRLSHRRQPNQGSWSCR